MTKNFVKLLSKFRLKESNSRHQLLSKYNDPAKMIIDHVDYDLIQMQKMSFVFKCRVLGWSETGTNYLKLNLNAMKLCYLSYYFLLLHTMDCGSFCK